MKYEKIYATQQQFTAAEGNSGNVTSIKPGVAFIEEREKTGFNKPHDTMITTNLDEVFINKVKVPVSSITSEYDFGGPGTYKVLYRYTSLTSMPASGFMGCVSIKTVVLPKSVSGNMPTLLFADCTKLSNIRIRGNVTGFGTNFFRNCTSLKVFRIPPSLTNIASSSFIGCTNISKVYVENWDAYFHMNDPQNVRDYPLRYSTGGTIFVNGKELITLDIPDNITFIPHYAFANCLSLRQVNGLNNATDIGTGAFKGCKNLVSIGENISGLTAIRNEAFSDCISLNQISLPDSLTSLGKAAYRNCSGATGELIIPSGVTTIGDETFRNCSGLSGLTFSDTITSIGISAFTSCTGFVCRLILPSGITSIGNYVFRDCMNLSGTLEIPSTLTSVGQGAFQYCKSISGTLVIPATLTTIGSLAFAAMEGLTNITLAARDSVFALDPFRYVRIGTTYAYYTGNKTGIFEAFCDTRRSGDVRICFEKILLHGNYSAPASGGYFLTCCPTTTEIRIDGDYTGGTMGLVHTYSDGASQLEFIEILGQATGQVLYGSNGGTAIKNNGIIHIGYDGKTNLTASNIFASNYIIGRQNVKVYFGDGSSQAHDQAILDQYLADSDWAARSTQLDTWYNYNGPYKS